MSTFVIKQGDLAPAIIALAEDSTGKLSDLTGTTIEFHMEDRTVDPPVVKLRATGSYGPDGPASAEMAYYWQSGDTIVPGVYHAEFLVSYPGTPRQPETYPNNDDIIINIVRNLLVTSKTRDWGCRFNFSDRLTTH